MRIRIVRRNAYQLSPLAQGYLHGQKSIGEKPGVDRGLVSTEARVDFDFLWFCFANSVVEARGERSVSG
jgi:hypothetical protein